MLYSLPNGKVIQISLEQFLDLEDEDIQCLMSLNYGDYIISPFHESSISRKKKKLPDPESESLDIDKSIDYIPEDEDKSQGDNTGIEEIPLDELPDIPDIIPE